MHVKSTQPIKADDTLIFFGEAVKALGNGRIGGHLVLFSSAADPDLAGDYFTKDTDFDIYEGKSIPVLYDHGLDPQLKRRKLGRATLKVDDAGVWAEAQLEMRDEYEKKIYEMVEAGKLGWSSGSAPHLTARTPVKSALRVDEWPIVEGSLTPHPCEPRTQVVSLKTYIEQKTAPAIKDLFGAELANRTMQVWELWSTLCRVAEKIAAATRATDVTGTVPDVQALVSEAVSSFALRATPAIVQQITDFAESSEEHFYIKSSFQRLTGGLVSGTPLQDHSDVVASAAKEHAENRAAFSEAVKGYTQRAENKLKFRIDDETKIGRKLSKANCEQMSVISAELRKGATADVELADTLDRLVATAMPKAADDDQKSLSEAARQELAKFLHTESRLLQAA